MSIRWYVICCWRLEEHKNRYPVLIDFNFCPFCGNSLRFRRSDREYPINEDSVPWYELHLSTTAQNRLGEHGIDTIGDLIKYSRRDLLNLRGIGYGVVKEIESELKKYGFKLR